MRWSILFLVLCMPLVFASENLIEYLTNSTIAQTYGAYTSSYILNDTFQNTPKQYTVNTTTIPVDQRAATIEGYTFSSTGNVTTLEDTRCIYAPWCWMFHGAGGAGTETPTIEYTTMTVDLSPYSLVNFTFSLVDMDLEANEFFEVYLFDGTSYVLGYQHNGTNNARNNATWTAAQFVTYTIPLSARFRVQNFKWFFRGTMDNIVTAGDQDAVFVENVHVNISGTKYIQFPLWITQENEVNVHQYIGAELYLHSTVNTQLNVTNTYYNMSGGTHAVFFNTSNVTVGNNNLTIALLQNANHIPGHDSTVTLNMTTSISYGHSLSLSWADVLTPSHLKEIVLPSEVNETVYRFNNATQYPIITSEFQSLNPIANVQLLRNNISLGYMYLCNATAYCFQDVSYPLTLPFVVYTIQVVDIVGALHEFEHIQNNTLPQAINLLVNWQGDFFVDVNESTLFQVLVANTQTNIPNNLNLTVNFSTLGEVYQLTFDPSSGMYETYLAFNAVGDYPFTINSNSFLNRLNGFYGGTVHVRQGFDVCFELYTDRNVTNSYDNDLLTLMAWPTSSGPQLRSLTGTVMTLDAWNNKGSNAITQNVFHAFYTDGQACMRLYDVGVEYTVYALDGVVSFYDNYDPPQITNYFGTIVKVMQQTLTPASTYKVYIPRIDMTWKRILNNLWPFIIFLVLLLFLLVCFAVGGPFGLVAGIVASIGFYVLVELYLKVFV